MAAYSVLPYTRVVVSEVGKHVVWRARNYITHRHLSGYNANDVEGGLGAVPGGVNDRMISLRYDFGPCVMKCTLHRAGLVLSAIVLMVLVHMLIAIGALAIDD